MLKIWEHVHPDGAVSRGASSFVLSNTWFIVGGDDYKSPLLKIATFDLSRAMWSQIAINTNGIVNRSYAASASVNGKTYIIGGKTGIGRDVKTCEEVLEVSSSVFGVTIQLCLTSFSCAKYGHSAVTVGTHLNRIFVYGGKSKPTSIPPHAPVPTPVVPPAKGAPPPAAVPAELGPDGNPILDAFLISFETGSPVIVPIEFEGEAPPLRDSHSMLVCGQNNQYVIVFGGKNGQHALKDMWLLDLSAVLVDAVVEEVAAGGKPGDKSKKKDPPKGKSTAGPTAIWTKLLDSKTCPARYSHNAYVSTSSTTQQLQLNLFGGFNPSGPIDSQLYTISIDNIHSGAKTIAGDFILETPLQIDPKALDAPLYSQEPWYGGIMSVVYDSDGRKPAFVIATGGHGITSEGSAVSVSTRLLALNYEGTSTQLNQIRNAIAANGYYRAAQLDESELNRVPTKLEYDNGDIYEGDLIRKNADNLSNAPDNLFRHGNGKMTYATGDTYEGSWLYDRKEGQGRWESCNGSVYEGSLVSDNFDGEGTFTDSSAQTTYSGQFSSGVYSGRGKLIDNRTRQVFDGYFLNGKEHGMGVLSGIWKPDIKTLYGVALDGVVEGEWNEGKLISGVASSVAVDGNGVWGSALHATFESLSKTAAINALASSFSSLSVAQVFPAVVMPATKTQSSPIGIYTGRLKQKGPEDENATCIYIDGSEFVGAFKSGRRNGIGKLTSVTKDEYLGKWVGNCRCGQGLWRSAHGDTYDGQWESDKPHGYGVRTYNDGSSMAGYWQQGAFTQATE